MNIENKKQVAIILLAVGLGLISAVLTGNFIKEEVNKETARLSQEFENKKVQPLVREIQALQNEMKQLASRQVTVAQKVGEGGARGVEAPAIPKSSLALRTPAGKRAYTVRIDSLSAVGGLINPGDYVDVIAHLEMPELGKSRTNKISTMVFQNVQILAVGTNLQAPGGYEQQQSARALNVTFALSPEEASLMSFIEKNGKMQLVLRAPAETEVELMQVANWNTLADYIFEKQGTELNVPRSRAGIEPVMLDRKDDVKPFIEIFKGGRSL
jgi:hypothetical protein